MTIENFTPVSAFAGGALIGLAAVLLLLLNGRIAGVSGIAGRLLNRGCYRLATQHGVFCSLSDWLSALGFTACSCRS
jgi:uncharacterized membrane protein YedE/YeeE